MKVFIGFERSGVLRRAFQRAGHWALSVDLMAADDKAPMTDQRRNGGHWQGDVFDVLACLEDESITPDLVILHPPCTYLTVSGLHWNKRRPGRAAMTMQALQLVERCWNLPHERLAIENPVGCINTCLPFMPKPQYVHSYMFGDDASKKTGWWTRGLPRLKPLAKHWWHPPRIVDGRKRWGNQTDSGQNKLPPSADRARLRGETYPGMAAALAEQWGAVA